MSERLITILGPTAVGKTDLTLRLAMKFNSVVISGDAYQIYRGLDVGTAKPSPDELAAVPHRLIDICDPDDSYSAADFQTMGATEITRCNAFMCRLFWKAMTFLQKDLMPKYASA